MVKRKAEKEGKRLFFRYREWNKEKCKKIYTFCKKVLAFSKSVVYTLSSTVQMTYERKEYVRVAQLDRASDYGSEGREFESSIARQKRLQIAISFLLPIQTSDAMIQT